MTIPALHTRLFLLLLKVCLFVSLAHGAETETGTLTFSHPETGERVVVFFVAGSHYKPGNPPVLVLHGMNRNPWDYRDAWIELAETHGLFVFVPYFRETEYPGPVGYNLGNVFASEDNLTRNPEALWSYRLPEIVFAHLQETGRVEAEGYVAFGHSAGSQFLHRKIAFVPDERLLLAVAANAGWYTFPDLETAWPYGYGGTGLTPDALPDYLASNLVLLLGDRDTDPKDRSLRKAPEAMRQGNHRFERGHTFFEAGRRLASELGVAFNWRIETVPGVGHDNARMAPAAARFMVETLKAEKER